MPEGIGYGEAGRASKMGLFSKKSKAKRKKAKDKKSESKAKKKKAELDIKRKNSRRGRQRAAMRDAGVDEKQIDKMLPWGKI